MNKFSEFFDKMKKDEHRVFEISMFSVSVVVGLVMLIVGGFAIYFTYTNYFSNPEAVVENEVEIVTGSSATVREEPEPTMIPTGSAIISGHDYEEDVDPELKEAESGYTTSNVNMRSEPSLTASVIAKVPMNTKVKFIKLHDNEWMEVEYNGIKGYINAMYLSVKKQAPIMTLPPVESTATPTPTSTPKPRKTPKPTKKPRPTATPAEEKPVKTVEPTAVPTPVPTTEPTKAPTVAPTTEPTTEPTAEPTTEPTVEPTV